MITDPLRDINFALQINIMKLKYEVSSLVLCLVIYFFTRTVKIEITSYIIITITSIVNIAVVFNRLYLRTRLKNLQHYYLSRQNIFEINQN